VRLIVGEDPRSAAELAAAELERVCLAAVARRGRALIAVSGGETPWLMLEEFARLELPWDSIHVAQVDERCVPRGDPRRNFGRIETLLVQPGRLPAANLLAMPVESPDLAAAALDYASRLVALAGPPLRIDMVQLGLGTDGHTASLVPGDPVLAVDDRDVALSGPYQGLRRMTLTLRALSAARERLWLVTGAAKAQRLKELLAGRGDAPSVRVCPQCTTVVADRAAATPPT
jgi:6-phosphogluconolactonase